MVRTRDFILYLVILLFVVTGAVYTGFTSRAHDLVQVFLASSDDLEPGEYTAEASSPFDRPGRLAILRAKLADGTDSRSDEVAVAVPKVEEVIISATASSSVRLVQYCNGPQTPSFGGVWPSQAKLSEAEGLRIVSTLVEQEVIGTSTEATVTEVELFTLPIRQVETGYITCLPDTLVGVTPSGQPLYNMASVYRSASASTLIGYARDGLPIYGALADSSKLDACGGAFENGQYRYYVRAEEDFILGCYAAIPSPIKIPIL